MQWIRCLLSHAALSLSGDHGLRMGRGCVASRSSLLHCTRVAYVQAQVRLYNRAASPLEILQIWHDNWFLISILEVYEGVCFFPDGINLESLKCNVWTWILDWVDWLNHVVYRVVFHSSSCIFVLWCSPHSSFTSHRMLTWFSCWHGTPVTNIPYLV